MPIYAYRCSNCAHENEVLQKLSDALLTVCPACQQETYTKQLTAPGFHLKGSGWYATDFKGGPKSEGDSGPKSESTAEPPPCQGGSGSCACP